MKKVLSFVAIISLLSLAACRSNKCNCPHWEKENVKKKEQIH